MQARPLVLLTGPDSERTVREWCETDRPFELLAVEPDEVAATVEERTVDALVCHADGATAEWVVDRARGADARLPVVVFATDDALDPTIAVELDVTRYVAVDDRFDPVAALAAMAPLIERQRRERRERTMLDSLLENIPLSVYFKDRQSRHVEVSDEMPRMTETGYIENHEGKRHHAPEDVLGKTDHDLYPPHHAESAMRDDRRVIETEEPIQDRVEHAFGSPLEGTYVATSKAPWYDEHGRVVGLVGITRDISERKQYERQLERQNERLERFAQVISHDLRNPLEVALGRIGFARETGAPEHFDAVERALERMDALVEDVLTLARQGETVTDPEPADLATAARAAWSVVDAPDATLSVTTEGRVLADPSRLRQLLENLFRNAVEHGSTSPDSQARGDAVEHGSTSPRSHAPEDAVEHGGDDVTVTVGDLDDEWGFFVADDGRGVPEADRERVFESGYSTGEEGTGLGLSIVRTIAEAHGWTVDLTESEAGGARFEFRNVERPTE